MIKLSFHLITLSTITFVLLFPLMFSLAVDIPSPVGNIMLISVITISMLICFAYIYFFCIFYLLLFLLISPLFFIIPSFVFFLLRHSLIYCYSYLSCFLSSFPPPLASFLFIYVSYFELYSCLLVNCFLMPSFFSLLSCLFSNLSLFSSSPFSLRSYPPSF